MLWLSFHLNSSKLAGRDSSGKTSSPTIRITRKGASSRGFLLTSALAAEFNRGIVLNLSSLAAKQGRELPEQGTKALPSPCADGVRAPPGPEGTPPAALTPDH
jgi:hypothetical protein